MAMVRKTKQRQAIDRVFLDFHRPLSCQEILDEAQKAIPGMGIATVYRAVKDMVEEEILHTVELPGEAPRYEPRCLDHHHHFQCRNCQRVFELPGCVDGLESMLPPGFRLQGHEIVLYGLCADCTKGPSSTMAASL